MTGTFDLVKHLEHQISWSIDTFGPARGAPLGVIDHIKKEIKELEDAPFDIEEWVDIMILAFDGAMRAGASPKQLVAALVAKQKKNEGRKWPDWRTAEPGKAIEHVRD